MTEIGNAENAKADSEGKICRYIQQSDDGSTWSCTKCCEWWYLEDGNPFENNMNYCPRCGRYIEALVKAEQEAARHD